MSKKEICLNNESFGYYSGFGGIEVKHIFMALESNLMKLSECKGV